MRTPFQLSDDMKLEIHNMGDALDAVADIARTSLGPTRIKGRDENHGDRPSPEARSGNDSAPPLPGQVRPANDLVNHPSHYTSHPSGVECIDVVEWMPFNVGNAIKYLWRAGQKDSAPTLRDMKKAQWYINREIDRLHRLGYVDE